MDLYQFEYNGEELFIRYPIGIRNDDGYVFAILKSIEGYYNDVLRVKGYVFLSDVLNRLGIEVPLYARCVGWMRDRDGDGFIDFGITPRTYLRFDLNFNCDGYILDKFD